MEYGKDYRATVVPVDIVEGPEGLIKVTDFYEMIPFTLRALLAGYKCTDEMLDRVEQHSGIFEGGFFPVEFFITYNPHTFAACITHTSTSIHLGNNRDILMQNEIMDLVESLPGSLKRPGSYQYLRKIDIKKGMLELKKRIYEIPIFDIALRYLSLSKFQYTIGPVKEQRYLMVLYIP